MARGPRREDVEFVSGEDRCAAWLYLPQKRNGLLPVIVMAHGLGAVKALRLDAYAERFAAAGYACLVFDYRHFGDSTGTPREYIDILRQREDWRNAVAYARSRPELDPTRVVVWGTSFGGGHALLTAADDPRIIAAIVQCPFTDGVASAAVMNPLTSVRLMVKAFGDLASAARGREPVRVPLTAEPGKAGLMTSPDAVRGAEALLEAAGMNDMPDLIPARVALAIPRHRPGRCAKDVRVPILFCVCDPDTVAPARATLRHARRAPRAEIKRYPYGHFDIYGGAEFEEVVADQLAFLRNHVPVGT